MSKKKGKPKDPNPTIEECSDIIRAISELANEKNDICPPTFEMMAVRFAYSSIKLMWEEGTLVSPSGDIKDYEQHLDHLHAEMKECVKDLEFIKMEGKGQSRFLVACHPDYYEEN
tara:strand:+ start:1089 stop:1433 length:345 start_codon:yes stop_codon:yes gene_type:complete